MHDLLVKNAMVVDGTGLPAFAADIAIRDGRITRVAPAIADAAAETRDAAGLIAVPGFIDIHRHGDLVPFQSGTRREEVSQGVTTFVAGVCGFSPVPNAMEYFSELREYAEPIIGPVPGCLRGVDFAGFLARIRKRPLTANMACLVGNGAARVAVAGFRPGPLTAEELAKVGTLVRESLAAGAFGLSIGLMYVPEIFYAKEELTAIFREPAAFGCPVFAHVRGEGRLLLESLREVLDAAREAGTALHISHLKAAGRRNWHDSIHRALDMLDAARAAGMDVTHDAYPYAAGSSAMHTLLPPELLSGGIPALLERLSDPDIRREAEADMRRERPEWDNLVLSTGWQSVFVAGGADASLVGRHVAEIAEDRRVSPEECAMLLVLENRGNLSMIFHSMSEDDVTAALTAPGAIVISDSLYSRGGLPHPRKYGSQARFIARYALDRRILTLEEAVRAVTLLPARRMGFRNRGTIAEGMAADLVLFDPARYRDQADFTSPCLPPVGIEDVVIGGKRVVREGRDDAPFAGKLLDINDA